MLTVHPERGPFDWWLTRELIGQDLRRRYTVPQEMPPRLLACVRKFGDAVEGGQFNEALSPSAPSLLGILDAIEGKQLLRACRTRLRALSYLQRLG